MERIEINFADQKQVKELIAKQKDFDQPLCAVNEDGENQLIYISEDGVVVKTYQNNGWTRETEYEPDGSYSCESYEK